jgi:DNA transformation protein and related proteins
VARAIQEMRNLGPAMTRWLAEIDIHGEDDLRQVGAPVAWHRLRFRFGRSISLIALYAMDAALSDDDWRSLPPERKAALRSIARGAKAGPAAN